MGVNAHWREIGRFVASTLLITATPVFALDLQEALKAARQSAVEIGEPEAELERARAEERAVKAMYDWTLFGNSRWAQDRSEQASAFAGDRRDQALGEFGARRLLPSATFLQASVKHQRDFTKFPTVTAPAGTEVPGETAVPTDPTALPDASQATDAAAAAASQAPPLLDPSKFQTFNPAYATRLDFVVKQPLWRNRFGRELRLQEEIAGTGTIQPQFERRIRLQIVQVETEQLYWSLAAVQAQIELTTALVEKSRRFADLMRKRAAMGRSDEVDVASADAAVVGQEGLLLNLELAAEEIQNRLAIRLNLHGSPREIHTPAGVLEKPPFSLPARTSVEAQDSAGQARQDLAMIRALRSALGAQTSLTSEQEKPNLSLVGSLATSGLESGAVDAAVDPFNDPKHMTYFFGLEFELSLDRTGPRTRRESVAAQARSLDARMRVLDRDIHREIELAFQAVEASEKRLKQAERNIRVLDDKRHAEFEKFQQARSEEVVVLRYEMEVLGAEADRIQALKTAREAEARLRFALHAYPVE